MPHFTTAGNTLTETSFVLPNNLGYKVQCRVYDDEPCKEDMFKCGICIIHINSWMLPVRFEAPFSTGRDNSNTQIVRDLAAVWLERAIWQGMVPPDAVLTLVEVVHLKQLRARALKNEKLHLSIGLASLVGSTAKHGN